MSRSKKGHSKRRHRKDNHTTRHAKQRSINYTQHVPSMLMQEHQSDLQYMFDFRTQLCSNPRCEKTRETCWNSHGRKPHRRIPRIVNGCFNYIPEPCQSHKQTTHCDAGDRCSKAHGWLEIIFHPLLYKTKLCEHSRENGVCCGYGAHCAKAHDSKDIRNLVDLFGADWKKHYHFQPPSLRPDFTSKGNRKRESPQSKSTAVTRTTRHSRSFLEKSKLSPKNGSYSDVLSSSKTRDETERPTKGEEKEPMPISHQNGKRVHRKNPQTQPQMTPSVFTLGFRPPELPPEYMWLYTFKTAPCGKTVGGCNTTTCEFFHSPLDRRRPFNGAQYTSVPCPQAFVNNRWVGASRCMHGDACRYSHSSYEVHYHPSQWLRYVAARIPKPGSTNPSLPHKPHKPDDDFPPLTKPEMISSPSRMIPRSFSDGVIETRSHRGQLPFHNRMLNPRADSWNGSASPNINSNGVTYHEDMARYGMHGVNGYSSNHGSNVTTNFENGDTTTSVGHLSDQDLEGDTGPPQAVERVLESLGIEFDDEQLKTDLNSNIHNYLDDSVFEKTHRDVGWGVSHKSLEDVFRPTDRDSASSEHSRRNAECDYSGWVDWTTPNNPESGDGFFYSATRVPLCVHCEKNPKNECFVPCGHTVCRECRETRMWRCCPQCGANIQQYQQFFLR